jgi:hypothetical protein
MTARGNFGQQLCSFVESLAVQLGEYRESAAGIDTRPSAPCSPQPGENASDMVEDLRGEGALRLFDKSSEFLDGDHKRALNAWILFDGSEKLRSVTARDRDPGL